MRKPWLLFAAAVLVWSSVEAQLRVVRVKPGFATVIVCPAPPELVSVGNPQQFTVQSSGNYLLVKPTVSSGSTNLFIKSGADSYNLLLQASETPDLEIRLLPTTSNKTAQPTGKPEDKATKTNGHSNVDLTTKNGTSLKGKAFESISPKARATLATYLKTPRPYTYSVKNSDVTLALDYMVQIEDRLYMICTIINNSKIPYDVGYVTFKLIDQASSYIFWKKKIKESEIEPVREFYSANIKPNSTGRLIFVFDKQGFSNESNIEIKCDEENGRRVLALSVPGSFVQ
jgi:hypothetical protein